MALDLYICRAPNLLIKQHGWQARIFSAMQTDKRLEAAFEEAEQLPPKDPRLPLIGDPVTSWVHLPVCS